MINSTRTMRIIKEAGQAEIKEIMRRIGVDPYGISIMLPKAISYLVLVKGLSSISANILKQEMLSLGADVAVAKGVLTGKVKRTDCLLMGQLRQFNSLIEKLKKQPFGLKELAVSLSRQLDNYHRDYFPLELGKFKFLLGRRTHIMGIINLTPDSFSSDGLYKLIAKKDYPGILAVAQQMLFDGADILDLGGESSRPGAIPVKAKEEMKRVLPVVKLFAKKLKAPVCVDTYKPEVAKACLEAGAVMVNDISGLRHPRMPGIIAKYKAAAVIMHMRNNPLTMQKGIVYAAVVDEIIRYLDSAVKKAQDCGIEAHKIIVDPGIGFGKLVAHNLQILSRLAEFKILGKPLLIGTSRKSFIGKILNLPVGQRINASVASSCLAAAMGAHIVRVHDVKEVKQGLKITDAIKYAGYAA